MTAQVRSHDESAIVQMLEHGVREWEFDTLRLNQLTGGHALAALGWALFERHHLREHLGFKSETVMTFLMKVSATRVTHVAYAACVTY